MTKFGKTKQRAGNRPVSESILISDFGIVSKLISGFQFYPPSRNGLYSQSCLDIPVRHPARFRHARKIARRLSLQASRLSQKIVQDVVMTLVKGARSLRYADEIKLERFVDAKPVGTHIINLDPRGIRLAGDRAET